MKRKLKLDPYFLTEECPYSGKRRIKTKALRNVAIGAVVFLVGFVLFAGGSSDPGDPGAGQSSPFSGQPMDMPRGGAPMDSMAVLGGGSGGGLGGIGLGGRVGIGFSSRQYSASQIVRVGPGNTTGFGLPMGHTFVARLINTLLSSDSSQPVIAEVGEDVQWRSSVLIPRGTRAIGQASFDDAAKRLQVRFTTLVYPEGDQHAISALALLEDGSSGIPGDYHSGATQRQAGRFLGNFVGGLAEGLKDREVAGQSGMAFEPGNLKNGLLNGVATSSLDQAKALSEDVEKVRPYLEVPGGTPFLLYLEKEYAP